MKKILLFLALGFALFAAPAAVVMYPQAAIADGMGGRDLLMAPERVKTGLEEKSKSEPTAKSNRARFAGTDQT
jgi:hypothetical protein